ncbi:hypothetical protein [Tsukamurella soli]|uniref:hypothetical protein n=1 Tax=Tsukamurella soli TaxID=644556 RepID=UPI00361D9F22
MNQVTGGRVAVAVLAALALVLGLTVTPPSAPHAQAAPRNTAGPGIAPADWTATHDAPTRYPGMAVDWDVPIRMSDGTILRANVYHPADIAGHVMGVGRPSS